MIWNTCEHYYLFVINYSFDGALALEWFKIICVDDIYHFINIDYNQGIIIEFIYLYNLSEAFLTEFPLLVSITNSQLLGSS
jgi:hypothetical protein